MKKLEIHKSEFDHKRMVKITDLEGFVHYFEATLKTGVRVASLFAHEQCELFICQCEALPDIDTTFEILVNEYIIVDTEEANFMIENEELI